jgi:macrodomain Ter protein organizer (MatP/YcbG family)
MEVEFDLRKSEGNRRKYGIDFVEAQALRKWRSMKAKEFDKRFDKGEDVTRFLDRSKARRPTQEQKRVNVDFPVWMIHSLDREAKRLGVTRQSIIKLWLAERLKEVSA